MSKKSFLNTDLLLLVPSLILVAISLTTLFSLNVSLFQSQLLYFFIGICAFFFFSQCNIFYIKHFSVQIYIISLILLSAILLLGFESRGAVRWLDVFGVRVQFSEILKPFLVITLAAFLSKRQPSFKTIFLTSVLFSPVILLVYKQPDLGNALIFCFALLLTFFVYGLSYIWFAIGIGVAIAIFPLFWKVLHEYQRQRILTFIHPTNDPLGTSYNAMQSIIAVGSGGFLGRGIGEGTQSTLRFLPERHTDFIFATISEGFGFVTNAIIFIAFAFLFYRIIVITMHTDDLFTKLFAIASFSFIAIQFFINIGMNMGILPITGVTLPFISYGGSSLVANFIFLGFLSAAGKTAQKSNILEIR